MTVEEKTKTEEEGGSRSVANVGLVIAKPSSRTMLLTSKRLEIMEIAQMALKNLPRNYIEFQKWTQVSLILVRRMYI